MSTSVDFEFRVWLHPEMGDPPDLEVWWYGLEATKPAGRFVSEWAEASLAELDFHSEFAPEKAKTLDKTKHWQIVGKARLRGWYDGWGEYDEELSILEFLIEEVPEEWFNQAQGLFLDLD